MRRRLSIGLMLLSGCPRREPVTVNPVEERPTGSGLVACPDGTLELGKPPPAATEVFCARREATGSITRHGASIVWHTNGQLRSWGPWSDGKRTGHWWNWADDGALLSDGDYVDGLESGYWLEYDAKGRIAAEGTKKAGQREGWWVAHTPDLGWYTTELWTAGQPDGVWTEFDNTGRAVRERRFRDGRQISQREL